MDDNGPGVPVTTRVEIRAVNEQFVDYIVHCRDVDGMTWREIGQHVDMAHSRVWHLYKARKATKRRKK